MERVLIVDDQILLKMLRRTLTCEEFEVDTRCKTKAGGEPRLIQTLRGVGYVPREEA